VPDGVRELPTSDQCTTGQKSSAEEEPAPRITTAATERNAQNTGRLSAGSIPDLRVTIITAITIVISNGVLTVSPTPFITLTPRTERPATPHTHEVHVMHKHEASRASTSFRP